MRLALLALGLTIAAAVPVDPPSFTVHLPAGRSTFVMGEVIQLDLEFNGGPDPDLYFSTETYDRSGRLGTETYSVAPEDGAVDPLADYFTSGVGFIGGGIRSWHPLDGTPFHLHVNLNEWVRFTRPGRYTLRVRSRRLHRYSNGPTPELVSDPVDLVVTAPSAEWAAGELARARAQIASGRPEQVQEGVAVLRHLGTREAAQALLGLYDLLEATSRFQAFAGLVASPFRGEIVSAMEQRIDAGNPLPDSYLEDAAMLRALVEVPLASGHTRERLDALARLQTSYRAGWAAAALRGDATVDRVRGVLSALAHDAGGETSLALAGGLAAHPGVSADAFVSLDRSSQRALLQYRWSTIRDAPWTRAALEKVFRAWKGDFRFPDVGDDALAHLIELDPALGRSLVLEEIGTGAHGVTYGPLSSLADPPPLDAVLQRRFERAHGDDRVVTLWLVARYGSTEMAPLVRRVLGGGADCATEGAALAFMLQHDPDEAIPRLQPGFDRTRGCVDVPWREIAPRYWDDRLEAAALAHVGLADITRAAQAIQILGDKGSAAAKGPLMERLAQWGQEWRGRTADLDRLRAGLADSPERIENALVNALKQNPRFALTAADIAQIRASCVTDTCRSIAGQPARRD